MTDFGEVLAVFVVGFAIGGLACGLAGVAHERSRLQTEAVKQGHAEWIVVDGQGSTEFRWKEDEAQPEGGSDDE